MFESGLEHPSAPQRLRVWGRGLPTLPTAGRRWGLQHKNRGRRPGQTRRGSAKDADVWVGSEMGWGQRRNSGANAAVKLASGELVSGFGS